MTTRYIFALSLSCVVLASCEASRIHAGYPETTFSMTSLGSSAEGDAYVSEYLLKEGFEPVRSHADAPKNRLYYSAARRLYVSLDEVDSLSRPRCVRVHIYESDRIDESFPFEFSRNFRRYLEGVIPKELEVYPSSDCVYDS